MTNDLTGRWAHLTYLTFVCAIALSGLTIAAAFYTPDELFYVGLFCASAWFQFLFLATRMSS